MRLRDEERASSGPGACIGDNAINQSINTILMACANLRNESCKYCKGSSRIKIILSHDKISLES